MPLDEKIIQWKSSWMIVVGWNSVWIEKSKLDDNVSDENVFHRQKHRPLEKNTTLPEEKNTHATRKKKTLRRRKKKENPRRPKMHKCVWL